jgi:hypothetical protein
MVKFRGLKKKIGSALVEQAWLAYKYGFTAGAYGRTELSKQDFCKNIKLVMERAKEISDFMPVKVKDKEEI